MPLTNSCVISNTFDAGFGRNSGAVVNVVTKSGTNKFHGDIYEYFRNTVLNGQGYFNTVKPQENQNQFGGTFGGPLLKDRTFFFVSYEGRRVRQGISGQTVLSLLRRKGPETFSRRQPSRRNRRSVCGAGVDGRPGCDAALASRRLDSSAM